MEKFKPLHCVAQLKFPSDFSRYLSIKVSSMTKENIIDFTNASNDFELLDKIRVRYQMYARDIKSLSGLLVGYSMAQEEYECNIQKFASYLTKKEDINPYAASWMDVISSKAEKTEYEIPIFYKLLDEYRQLIHDRLGIIELTWEQRDFNFRMLIEKFNIDYPELPIKAPHKLEVLKISGSKVHAFYYDKTGIKYYEQCLGDFSRLKKWAKDSFNINESQW